MSYILPKQHKNNNNKFSEFYNKDFYSFLQKKNKKQYFVNTNSIKNNNYNNKNNKHPDKTFNLINIFDFIKDIFVISCLLSMYNYILLYLLSIISIFINYIFLLNEFKKYKYFIFDLNKNIKIIDEIYNMKNNFNKKQLGLEMYLVLQKKNKCWFAQSTGIKEISLILQNSNCKILGYAIYIKNFKYLEYSNLNIIFENTYVNLKQYLNFFNNKINFCSHTNTNWLLISLGINNLIKCTSSIRKHFLENNIFKINKLKIIYNNIAENLLKKFLYFIRDLNKNLSIKTTAILNVLDNFSDKWFYYIENFYNNIIYKKLNFHKYVIYFINFFLFLIKPVKLINFLYSKNNTQKRKLLFQNIIMVGKNLSNNINIICFIGPNNQIIQSNNNNTFVIKKNSKNIFNIEAISGYTILQYDIENQL